VASDKHASDGGGAAAGEMGPPVSEVGGAGQGSSGPGAQSGGPAHQGPVGQGMALATKAGTAVEIVSLPTPEYPPRSRRLGEEGLVLLEVEVLPDGRVGTVRVLQAPDYPRLVDAAIEAVRSAAFRPATTDGRPVRAFVEVPIRFRLD
jgi:protein TonB